MVNLTDEQKEALGIKDERKDFYFKVENEVIDNPEVFDTDREFILFIVLSRYCNNNQIAYPSLETLAKKSRCTKRNLIKALNGLVEKGLVKKVKRYDEETKTYQSNLYAVQTLKEYIVKDKDNNYLKEVVSLSTLGGGVASDTRGSDAIDTRVVSLPTPNKEQVIKNNYKKNHDHDNELDFFENLFKEFGINFTTTNKESVLRLRKSLSLKDVELYLRETYQAIKDNKDVVNVAALFSSKIAKGERQINSKPKEKNKENIKTIELEEIKLEEVKEFKKETIKDTNNKIEKTDKIEKINEMDQQEQAINESLEKYSNLTPEEQNEIEEQAIELLCKCENLEKGFVIGAKKTSSNIYTGMVRKYIHECISTRL